MGLGTENKYIHIYIEREREIYTYTCIYMHAVCVFAYIWYGTTKQKKHAPDGDRCSSTKVEVISVITEELPLNVGHDG